MLLPAFPSSASTKRNDKTLLSAPRRFGPLVFIQCDLCGYVRPAAPAEENGIEAR
jgi:hypothetical protein